MQLLCSLGHGGPHSLNPNLQLKEQMLRKALIMYLGVASEYTGALSQSETTSGLRKLLRARNYCCFVTYNHHPTTAR